MQNFELEDTKKELYCQTCQKELNIPKNIQGKLNEDALSKEEAINNIFKKHTKNAHTVITGVKFKLILNNDQKNKFNEYFSEYAKAVTFCAKVVYRQRRFLKFIGKKEGNKWIYSVGECDYCGSNQDLYYHDQVNAKKICKDCYNNEFSDNAIRKKMIPVSKNLTIFRACSKITCLKLNFLFLNLIFLLSLPKTASRTFFLPISLKA